jgi:hypothetical protein
MESGNLRVEETSLPWIGCAFGLQAIQFAGLGRPARSGTARLRDLGSRNQRLRVNSHNAAEQVFVSASRDRGSTTSLAAGGWLSPHRAA